MRPLRTNTAPAIDGRGIKGETFTNALAMLENELKQPVNQIFQLTAGTSTGSIISAGLACGLTATQMYQLYVELGDTIFKKSWRTTFFPLSRYRYPNGPLMDALTRVLGN